VTVRLRPEDLLLAPPSADRARDLVSFPAQAVDAQFGGRHMDVIVRVKDARLHARVPTAAFGGWARRLRMDEDVVASFAPSSAVYYGEDDARLAGHVDVEALVTAGV
jgi:iron(III) transport system ATP-binding protein